MSGLYLGVDPGLTGALTELRYDNGVASVRFHDAPTYKDGKRTRIDVAGALELLGSIERPVAAATVEKLQPMPTNGSIANFSSGYSMAVWVTALAALDIPYQLVTPQAWKKALMAGADKEKDASRIVAGRLFPTAVPQLSRKLDHNRADSLLIAEYGRRLAAGTQERGA